jgi:ABC-2 type transport system permease protein
MSAGLMRPTAAALSRVTAIARKEFLQLLRDRLTLAMMVGIPSLQLVLFGYAIDVDVRHVPTAVLDRSQTAESRKLLGELQATQTFDLVREAVDEHDATRLLQSSRVGAVIVIPPDYAREFHRGRGAIVSILADASDPTVSRAIALSAQGFAQSMTRRMRSFSDAPGDQRTSGLERDLVRPDSIRIEVLPLYNPERRTAVFVVPGLIGVILTMTMMLFTALAVVRERERGTFEFLIATPVRRGEVMLGKIVPYLIVGFGQVGIVLALGVLLFDVPIRGSLWQLALGALPFLAAMLSVGLLVSSVSRSQLQATQLSFFFFLPSMLLSGFMFPFDAMPVAAQWIGEVLPLTHFLRIVRGIVLKGATLQTLGGELAAIGAFFVVAFVLASLTFRKRLG